MARKCDERQLKHSAGDAERFYWDAPQKEIGVRLLLAALGFELWIGDPAEIQAKAFT